MIAQEDVFIYSVAPKIKGQYDFILLEPVNDSIAIKTYYRFIYKKKHFTVYRKNISSDKSVYTKRSDGNIFEGRISDGREIIFYTSQSFQERMKDYPPTYFDIFSSNFLALSNSEKKLY